MPPPRPNKEFFSIHKNHRKEDLEEFKNEEGRYNSPIHAAQKKTPLE